MDLLTIGLTTLDVVARPIEMHSAGEHAVLIEAAACAPAGTAAAVALIGARLGLKTQLISAVGDDFTGRFITTALAQQGVDVRLLATLPGIQTSTTIIPTDTQGRRAIFHAPGAGSLATVSEAARQALRGVRFVHYAGIGGPQLDGGPGASFIQEAKAQGAIVTCDLVAPGPTAAAELVRLLPHIDYFLPSAAEAVVLSGSQDLAVAAGRFLALGAKACIIKDGERGVLAAVAGETRRVAAHAVTAVDTTSCGDSFCAGFIVGLSRGWSWQEACRFGVAAAAQVAQGMATLGRLESFEQVLATMQRSTSNNQAAR